MGEYFVNRYKKPDTPPPSTTQSTKISQKTLESVMSMGYSSQDSLSNLKNRDFADISTLGIRKKTPFYRFSGRLTVQITFMFFP